MLIELLEKTFAERCRKNPQYSLRAFARALDMDPSTLSAILRRKRTLTPKTARRLVEKLDIASPAHAQTLLLSVIEPIGASVPEYDEFALETAEMISSWEHFAILAYFETNAKKRDVRSIALRLRLPQPVVIEALHRMQKIGLVEEVKTEWKLKSKNFATPSNVPNAALREANRQMVLKAAESIDLFDVEQRDVTGITFAADSKRLKEAKTMIKDFRRKLVDFLENGDSDQVYRLNIQIFPLTVEEGK